MGMMVDTNVFIQFERARKSIDFSSFDLSAGVFISVMTVSELLMGVHRADNDERRQRRSAFVEAVIGGVSVIEFTVAAARVHSEIYSQLAKMGQMIAATARYHNFSILTDNVQEFSRVPGLNVIPFVV